MSSPGALSQGEKLMICIRWSKVGSRSSWHELSLCRGDSVLHGSTVLCLMEQWPKKISAVSEFHQYEAMWMTWLARQMIRQQYRCSIVPGGATDSGPCDAATKGRVVERHYGYPKRNKTSNEKGATSLGLAP
jgi:hypothetical protein